jgi:hypothetical protein
VIRTIVSTGFARRLFALLVLCALGVAQGRGWACPMGLAAPDTEASPSRAVAHDHAHMHGARADALTASSGARPLVVTGTDTPRTATPLDAGCATTMSCAQAIPAPWGGWNGVLTPLGTTGDPALPSAAAIDLAHDTPPPRLPA